MARARTSVQSVSRSFGSSLNPIYMLDEQRIIQYCNRAFCEWTGVDEPHILGIRCDYHSAPDGNAVMRIAAGLCPPPDVLQGQTARALVAIRRGDETVSERMASFSPLFGADGEVSSTIAIVDSVDQTAATDFGPGIESSSELHARLRRLRNELGSQYRIEQLVGESPWSQRLREQVRLAAETGSNVNLVGAIGSGREHLARTIHTARSTGQFPIVPVDCSLMDTETLSAALQAIQRAPSAGPDAAVTLLLLNAESLSSDAQLELWRWLSPRRSNLCVLSTTTRSLPELARWESFRNDLAYLLSVVTIEIPNLSDRREDLRLLAQLILEQQNVAAGKQLAGFAADALSVLEAYPWPGQMEEFLKSIQEACQQCQTTHVSIADLPESIRAWGQANRRTPPSVPRIILDDVLEELQRELVAGALARTKNNRTKAADLLGVSRPRLLRLIEQFGLQSAPPDWDPLPEPEPGLEE